MMKDENFYVTINRTVLRTILTLLLCSIPLYIGLIYARHTDIDRAGLLFSGVPHILLGILTAVALLLVTGASKHLRSGRKTLKAELLLSAVALTLGTAIVFALMCIVHGSITLSDARFVLLWVPRSALILGTLAWIVITLFYKQARDFSGIYHFAFATSLMLMAYVQLAVYNIDFSAYAGQAFSISASEISQMLASPLFIATLGILVAGVLGAAIWFLVRRYRVRSTQAALHSAAER